MYDMPSLEILEVNYSCSPGGVDMFEVYDKTNVNGSPIFSSEILTESITFCYNQGRDFIVRTHAEWEARELAYEASR